MTENVAAIVRRHGQCTPGKIAVETVDRSLTFDELDQRSNQVAQALRAAGVREDDRVAYLGKNGLDWFEVCFGAAKLGAVFVSVNWRLADPEIIGIVEDSGASVFISGLGYGEQGARVAAALSQISTFISSEGSERSLDYEAWVQAAKSEDPGVDPTGEAVAFQLYTSGTTGIPKGVMLTNKNLYTAFQSSTRWQLDGESVNLAAMPLFHIGGAGWAMVGLHLGCTTVTLRDAEPGGMLEAISRFRVTNAFVVPALLQIALDHPALPDSDVSSLRALVYGASPISEIVLERSMKAFGCDFIQVYGLTETNGAIAQLDPSDHDPARPWLLRSCGKAYPNVEIKVVNSQGEDVRSGDTGELWTRSDQNMLGYWKNEPATAEVITDDGWFKTGDAGHVDDEGFIYLSDRVKDMIVSGGENVYPTEVENVLMKHPGVGDCAVIGVPDERWGEAVKAIVVSRSDHEVAGPDLIAFCRERLAGYKLPKSVDFVEDLPRNPAGKVLKRDLRRRYWGDRDRAVG